MTMRHGASVIVALRRPLFAVLVACSGRLVFVCMFFYQPDVDMMESMKSFIYTTAKDFRRFFEETHAQDGVLKLTRQHSVSFDRYVYLLFTTELSGAAAGSRQMCVADTRL